VSRNDSGPRPLTTPRTLELSFNGSDFDFDQTISWKSRDADRGSRRWIVFEKCCVNFIHPREQQFIDQKYMSELVFGKVVPETRISLLDIVKQMRRSKNIDGLILGGTELSLILSDGMMNEVPFLDTTSIHVNAAVTHMVAESPIIR